MQAALRGRPFDGLVALSRGRAAASHVAALLRGESIRAIYASTARRAVQTTVEPLAELLGLAVTTVKDLRERRLSGEPVDDHGAAVAWCWANPAAALRAGSPPVITRRWDAGDRFMPGAAG